MSTLPRATPNRPTCPVCRGTGWKMQAAGDGAGLSATRCDCEREARHRELLATANIPPRYYHCTLEGFDVEPYAGAPEALRHARLLAQGFVENYPTDKRGLILTGPSGVGKSHLAVAIIRELLERGFGCRYADYRDTLKQIQLSYDPEHPSTEAQIVQPLIECEVLLLDDLGVGRSTDFALETVHYILNSRYMQERTTVITTNLADRDPVTHRLENRLAYQEKKVLLDAVGERMRSRLYEMCRVVEVTGDDFRQRVLSH